MGNATEKVNEQLKERVVHVSAWCSETTPLAESKSDRSGCEQQQHPDAELHCPGSSSSLHHLVQK